MVPERSEVACNTARRTAVNSTLLAGTPTLEASYFRRGRLAARSASIALMVVGLLRPHTQVCSLGKIRRAREENWGE